ncbi:hypothetical protein ACVIHF_008652 [Bradyrhizobium sp. USDA 4506]
MRGKLLWFSAPVAHATEALQWAAKMKDILPEQCSRYLARAREETR